MVIIPWWRRVCAAHFEHHFPVSVGDFVDFCSISMYIPCWVSLAQVSRFQVLSPSEELEELAWPKNRDGWGTIFLDRFGNPYDTKDIFHWKMDHHFYGISFFPQKKGSIWRCPSSARLPFVSRAFWRRCQDQKDSSEEPSDDSARRWDPGQCSKRSFGCSKSMRFPRRKVWRKESELLVLGC